MSCGAVLLTLVIRQWQVYAAFAVMSFGWATMSGAAINIIVAPACINFTVQMLGIGRSAF